MTECQLIRNKIVSPKNNIITKDFSPMFSTNQDYPRFSYGFHHFVHATKNKMDAFEKFEDKKKVYTVVNDYNINIDNYDQDIFTKGSKLFSKSSAADPSTYQIWELLREFDLAQGSDFTSVHFGSEHHIESVAQYRDRGGKNKSDRYIGVGVDSGSKNSKVSLEKTKLQDVGSIDAIKKSVKGADLVTSELSIPWGKDNQQEPKSFNTLFLQILAAIKLQKKGGSYICKVYETFTHVSVQLIEILTYFYDEVYVCRPLTCVPSEQDRYVVCKKFKFSDSDVKKEVGRLEKLVTDILGNQKNIVNLASERDFEKDHIVSMIQSTTRIENIQIKYINLMVDFINGQNFFGELYHQYRDKQIEATKAWLAKNM